MVFMYLIGFLGYYFFVMFLSIFCFPILYNLCSCYSHIFHEFFYFFSHYTMSKSIKKSQRNIAREVTSSNSRKWKNFSYQSEHGINFIRDRWLYIKTQEIVSDLTQILIFTKKLEKSGAEHLEVCDQLSDLLSQLQQGKRDNRYMQIVQVITKYLDSIRNFVENTDIHWALSYKALFESTIIAIRRELDHLEEAY